MNVLKNEIVCYKNLQGIDPRLINIMENYSPETFPCTEVYIFVNKLDQKYILKSPNTIASLGNI